MIVRSGDDLRRAAVYEAAPKEGRSTVAAWLTVLMRMLRLPANTRTAIRDELEEHLRERVRDLVLAGSTESEAQQIAVSELGETAELARRLECANRSPKRRLAMQLSLLGLGAVVVTSGALVLAPGSTAIQPSQFDGRRVERTPPPELTEYTVSIPAEATVGEVVAMIDEAVPQSILLRWEDFENEGADSEDPVAVVLDDIPVPDAMRILSETLEDYGVFEWRFGPRVIEFAPQRVFDHREGVLVSYSIGGILMSIEETFGSSLEDAETQIVHLIQEMVDSNAWADNGGDVAMLRSVGGKMFVQAPPRIHAQVEWILTELGKNPDMEAGRGEGEGKAPDRLDGSGMPIDEERAELQLRQEEWLEHARAIVMTHEPDHPEYQRVRKQLREMSSTRGIRFRAGDQVQVRVFELYVPGKWETFARRVDDNGLVRLPEIGVVPAGGLTEEGLETLVTKLARERLRDPVVDVLHLPEDSAAGLHAAGRSQAP